MWSLRTNQAKLEIGWGPFGECNCVRACAFVCCVSLRVDHSGNQHEAASWRWGSLMEPVRQGRARCTTRMPCFAVRHSSAYTTVAQPHEEGCAPWRGPSADVAEAGPVPAQMWQGRAQSRCRCGTPAPESAAPRPLPTSKSDSPMDICSPGSSAATRHDTEASEIRRSPERHGLL